MRQRILLFFLSLFSFVISSFVAILYLHHFGGQNKILGKQTQYLSRIQKSTVNFPSDGTLKNYYEPKPNTTIVEDKQSWLPYVATYSINAEGLNDLKNYTQEKKDNVFRIISLGDSFTFGQYVNTKDNYPSQLENLLSTRVCGKYSKVEVLNLGMMGYDIQYAVERFSLHGLKYNPDLVTWLVNDWNLRQITELLMPLEEKINNETSQSARLKQYENHNYYFAANQATEELINTYSETEIMNQQKQFLNRFSTLYNGPLAIFMFSQADGYLKNLVRTYVDNREKSYLLADLPDISGQYALPDGHPSKMGHVLIAKNMYNYLISDKIIPCQ